MEHVAPNFCCVYKAQLGLLPNIDLNPGIATTASQGKGDPLSPLAQEEGGNVLEVASVIFPALQVP